MDPGDIFQTLFGRPPAEARLAGMLGQAPGQAGSPQGPQPLAGQNAPSGGPAGPGGSPDPSGGPAAPQQPPQPQVYQSPPDLAQAYMALSQQNQAKQDFWGGLAGVAQALHPGRVTPGMVKSITGTSQDPGTMFNNLMQIQQYKQQNLALQAFQRSVPDMMKQTGLTADEITANPQAAMELMGKIAQMNAGVSSDPTIQEMNRAKGVYMAQNGITNPNDPLIPDKYKYPEQYKAGVQGDVAHAKEMQDFKDNGVEDLPSLEPRLDKGEKTVDTLLGNMDATMTALQAPGFLTRGPVPGYLGGGPYGQDVKDAAAAMATLKAQLAGEGLKDTKNVRNKTEFNALSESMTAALDPSNSPAQVQQALQDIKTKIARAHAQALAVAGKQVPYAYKGLADQRFFTKGDPYYTGATQEDAPADSSGGGGGPQQSGGGSGGAPPVPGAKKAADGNWYVPDPARPGKYQRVD